MNKKLVIIPAYNEEKNISRVIEGVKEFGYDIVVVNDCSNDRTSDIVKGEGIKLLSNPINLGAGGALQTGYKYAVEKGYDYIVNLDGDGQHDPRHIDEMLEPIINGRADIVIGSRFMHTDSYKPPAVRRIGMRLFSFIANIITEEKITDTTSGYKAMTREIAEIFASPSFPCDYPDVDTLIFLYLKGFKIKEIPVKMYANNEKSIHSGIIKPLYYVFKMILSILMTILREGNRVRLRKQII